MLKKIMLIRLEAMKLEYNYAMCVFDSHARGHIYEYNYKISRKI